MAGVLQGLQTAWSFLEKHSNGVSIILSIVGFAIVWLQLRKTAGAAEAAARASKAAIEAIGHADTISDVSAVQAGLREVQVALRGKRYEAALLRAQVLRESLARLRSRKGFEGDERQGRIQKVITDLRILQDKMERVLEDSSGEFSAAVANKTLADAATEMSSFIEELRFQLKGESS